MSLGRVFTGEETLQGPVHAGGPHAQAHRGETTPMHRKHTPTTLESCIGLTFKPSPTHARGVQAVPSPGLIASAKFKTGPP